MEINEFKSWLKYNNNLSFNKIKENIKCVEEDENNKYKIINKGKILIIKIGTVNYYTGEYIWETIKIKKERLLTQLKLF